MQRQNNNSEVARLMRQIKDEHIAAQRGLSGVAEGVAKHRYIEAHMLRMSTLKTELSQEIGEKAALTFLCQTMLDTEQ